MRSFDHAAVIFSINPQGRKTKNLLLSFWKFQFSSVKRGNGIIVFILYFTVLSYIVPALLHIHQNALKNNAYIYIITTPFYRVLSCFYYLFIILILLL